MLLLNSVLLLPTLLLLLLLVPSPSSAGHSPKLSVRLSNGSPLLGKYLSSHSGRGIRAFTNIPYAEPPVGALRFADPVPKAPWTCASALPPSDQSIVCPQREIFFHGAQFVGQEDCLYLNVYAPLQPKAQGPLPVLFFIHGGGFASGAGSQTLYGPEFLLDEDVVLVAGNYRLGALGFLSTFSAQLGGNYGLKDQALMLRWVHENIAQFNGDPQRVTIFGESAGAGSVGYHLLAPGSRGLFQGAILQSGNPFENWANVSQRQSLEFAEKMLRLVGCELVGGDHESALECARGKEAREFVDQMDHLLVWGHHPVVTFAPVKEVNSVNPFITEADYLSGTSGQEVPVMIGVTANEGGFIAAGVHSETEIIPELEAKFDELIPAMTYMFDRFGEATGEKVKLIKERYMKGDFKWPEKTKGMIDLNTDIIFLTGISRMIDQRLKNKGKTFVYKFNYRGSVSFTDIALKSFPEEIDMGVSHIDDLLYLFPTVKNVIKWRVMSDQDQKMREQMVKFWVNFAKNGDPSTEKYKWKAATKYPLEYMRIGNCNLDVCDEKSKLATEMESGFFEESLEFVNKLYGYNGLNTKAKEEL